MEGADWLCNITTRHSVKPCKILSCIGSQSDFGKLESRGKQCSCIVVMFLTKAEQKGSLQTWTSADLTEILQNGTVFYESIDMKFKDKNGFVDIEALKGNVQMCNEVFVVRIPEVPQGVLNSAARLAGGMLTLEQTLEKLDFQARGLDRCYK